MVCLATSGFLLQLIIYAHVEKELEKNILKNYSFLLQYNTFSLMQILHFEFKDSCSITLYGLQN